MTPAPALDLTTSLRGDLAVLGPRPMHAIFQNSGGGGGLGGVAYKDLARLPPPRGKNQDVPVVLAAKGVRGASIPPVFIYAFILQWVFASISACRGWCTGWWVGASWASPPSPHGLGKLGVVPPAQKWVPALPVAKKRLTQRAQSAKTCPKSP